jgi:hypothetical protein
VPEDLARAADGRDLERAASLLDRVEALERETLGVLERAREATDARTILAAIRQQRANLEVVGRLKGELVTGGTTAIVMRFGVRDEAELESLIEGGRKLEQITADVDSWLEKLRDDAVEVLRQIFLRRPEFRSGVLESLGGRLIHP